MAVLDVSLLHQACAVLDDILNLIQVCQSWGNVQGSGVRRMRVEVR